jgi:hypothetical protein
VAKPLISPTSYYTYSQLEYDSLNPFALSFDGTTSFVNIPHISAYNIAKVTLEMWFRWGLSGTTINFLIAKAAEQLEIQTAAGGVANSIRFIPTTGVYLDTPTQSFVPGQWVHVACIYDPSISFAKVYINGVDTNAVNTGPNPLTTAIITSTNPIQIGRRGAPSTFFYNGLLDEVRIWNVVRSLSQIQEARSRSLIGNESGLVGYWRFDEGTGIPTADATVNSNTGTLTGATWTTSAAPLGLADTEFTIAVNNGGTHDIAWYAGAHLARQFIGSAFIADLAVLTAKIADLAVSTAKIGALAVTNAKISDVQADKITTGLLAVLVGLGATGSPSIVLDGANRLITITDPNSNKRIRLGKIV